jgi:hypothetical protein
MTDQVRSGLGGCIHLDVSHDPPLVFTAANCGEVACSRIHTAEVTGSIPVAPTRQNAFPEVVPGAVCQKICQKITGCGYGNALSIVPFPACG